jgi:hypothetical protein
MPLPLARNLPPPSVEYQPPHVSWLEQGDVAQCWHSTDQTVATRTPLS